MRTPPVWRTRLVGLFSRIDRSGSARSTRTASVRPNASMSSRLALGSGKCSRVADATPSSAWQPRHCAASKIGYTVRENEIGPVTACCAEIDATTTANEPATTKDLPFMLGSRTERHPRRRACHARHQNRRVLLLERHHRFRRHVGFADVQPLEMRKLREAAQRVVADGGVRQIEAREVRQRFERRGGGVVYSLDVPQTETTQIAKRGQRLQPACGHRRTAQVETMQLLERRELREA